VIDTCACALVRQSAAWPFGRVAGRGLLDSDACCSACTTRWCYPCPVFAGPQVMKLGVIRVLAKKIPALLKVLCKGGFARWGPWKKTVVAMSERSRHMSRISNASIVAPGYVC